MSAANDLYLAADVLKVKIFSNAQLHDTRQFMINFPDMHHLQCTCLLYHINVRIPVLFYVCYLSQFFCENVNHYTDLFCYHSYVKIVLPCFYSHFE